MILPPIGITLLPLELVELVFYQLAHNPVNPNPKDGYCSIIALATTCKFYYDAFYHRRAFWISLFSTKFDAHPHHHTLDFDVHEEYKRRIQTLNNIARWGQSGGHFTPHPKLIDFIILLASEHRELNFQLFGVSPGVSLLLRHQLLAVFRSLSWRGDIGDDAQRWLAAIEFIVTSDCDLAEAIVWNAFAQMNGSFDLRDPLDLEVWAHLRAMSRYPSEHVKTVQDAQRAHIIVRRLLCSTLPHDMRCPALQTTWTNLVNMRLPPLSMLCGRWVGYYGGTNSDRKCIVRYMTFTLRVWQSSEKGVPYRLSSHDGAEETGPSTCSPFTLTGHVESTGRVLLSKTSGSSFHGFILPWGIAGTYDGSLFWVWREHGEVSV